MKLPSLALVLVASSIGAASGEAASIDVSKYLPTMPGETKNHYSILVDANEGYQSCDPGKTIGLAAIEPAFKIFLKSRAGVNPFSPYENEGTAMVQMTHLTKTSRFHADHLPPDEKGVRNPVPKGSRVAFLPTETNHDAYFEVNGMCLAIEKGRLIEFDGSCPHRTVVNSGSVHLLGPYEVTTMMSVGTPPPSCPDHPCPCETDEGDPGKISHIKVNENSNKPGGTPGGPTCKKSICIPDTAIGSNPFKNKDMGCCEGASDDEWCQCSNPTCEGTICEEGAGLYPKCNLNGTCSCEACGVPECAYTCCNEGDCTEIKRCVLASGCGDDCAACESDAQSECVGGTFQVGGVCEPNPCSQNSCTGVA